MASRLADLGSPVDITAIVEDPGAAGPRSVGRPHLARALVDAGYATDVGDAFDRFLRTGGPAFVPRVAPSPFDAVRMIRRAGGCSSLAHPGTVGHDELIPELVAAGLDALEAFHPDHAQPTVERYRQMARRYGLAVTGGSDYHADPAHGTMILGGVVLPPEEFEALRQRHGAGAAGDRRGHA
jgi:predicted metal-dependent phosphoesterase TrpH